MRAARMCPGSQGARGRGARRAAGLRGARCASGMVIRGSSACFEKSVGHFANECVLALPQVLVMGNAGNASTRQFAHQLGRSARNVVLGAYRAYIRWRFDRHFFRFTHSRSKRPALAPPRGSAPLFRSASRLGVVFSSRPAARRRPFTLPLPALSLSPCPAAPILSRYANAGGTAAHAAPSSVRAGPACARASDAQGCAPRCGPRGRGLRSCTPAAR